jgi:hypothetical protein
VVSIFIRVSILTIRSTDLGLAVRDSLEKYYCGAKKYRYCAKKLLTGA